MTTQRERLAEARALLELMSDTYVLAALELWGKKEDGASMRAAANDLVTVRAWLSVDDEERDDD